MAMRKIHLEGILHAVIRNKLAKSLNVGLVRWSRWRILGEVVVPVLISTRARMRNTQDSQISR